MGRTRALAHPTAVHRLLFLATLLLALSGCESLFFYPQRTLRPNPHLAKVAHTEVELTTPDGLRLHGWRLAPPATPPRATILFFHGNAENISTHVNGVLWLALAGYQVVLFDYRGYGQSEGKPTLAGIHQDGEAALAWVRTGGGVDPARLVVYGQSMGGAVATYAVARAPGVPRVRALIVESGFASYRDIFRQKLATFFLTWPFQIPLSLPIHDDLSPARWIGRVSPTPVLLVHGDRDPIVGVAESRRLYDQARQPKALWIGAGAGHITTFADPALRARLLAFLAAATAVGETTEATQPR